MMTSKERAELRAQANTLDTILMVGKGGVSETLIAEAERCSTRGSWSRDVFWNRP